MKISNELRVGIMFFTGLLLLVLLIATMTRWGQNRGGYSFDIRFTQAQGVLEGADARVSGVKVGQVTAVSLDPQTNKALVTVRIDNRVRLYHGYIYTVGIGGLVGERYIEIRPMPDRGAPVEPGDTVEGTTTADINEVIDSANALIAQVSKATESLNTIVGDAENQQNIKSTLANLEETSQASAQLTKQFGEMLRRNQRAVDLVVLNLLDVSRDIKAVSDTLTPQLQNTQVFANLETASENAVLFTERLQLLADAVETLVQDPQVKATLTKAIENLEGTTAELEKTMEQVRIASQSLPPVAKNVEQASANVEKASADLPKITAPFAEVAPETAQNVLQISENLRETSETVSGAAQRIVKLGASLGSIKVEPEASIMALPNNSDQNTRADVNVNVRSGGNMFRLGVADIGHSSKLNLQFGNRLRDNLWLRYGIVQSQFGFGADYQPSDRLHLSGELFDFEDLRANATIDYRLRNLGDGWWLSSSWYNIFDDDQVGIGLTYRP